MLLAVAGDKGERVAIVEQFDRSGDLGNVQIQLGSDLLGKVHR
jgi:hypothetical protein